MNKEIVIICGINAAGKSTLVEGFVKDGYTRFNRDIAYCSMDELHKMVGNHLLTGNMQVVLDNTYPSVKSRKPVIDLGKQFKIPVRCVHLTTSMEDAQLNACLRMVRKTGRLLQPDDFKKINDPNLFPPVALFHYRKEFQNPTKIEGFSKVEEVPFIRHWGPEYKNKALILDYDGTLRLSKGKQDYPTTPSEIEILPGRSERIKEYKKKGYILLGASNQSGIARGSVTEERVIECFEETNSLLDVNIYYRFCPHRIPPVSCYCRKPHCGLGALFIENYKLNPSQCIMVGDMTTDETFAKRCGFQFIQAAEFFK